MQGVCGRGREVTVWGLGKLFNLNFIIYIPTSYQPQGVYNQSAATYYI